MNLLFPTPLPYPVTHFPVVSWFFPPHGSLGPWLYIPLYCKLALLSSPGKQRLKGILALRAHFYKDGSLQVTVSSSHKLNQAVELVFRISSAGQPGLLGDGVLGHCILVCWRTWFTSGHHKKRTQVDASCFVQSLSVYFSVLYFTVSGLSKIISQHLNTSTSWTCLYNEVLPLASFGESCFCLLFGKFRVSWTSLDSKPTSEIPEESLGLFSPAL